MKKFTVVRVKGKALTVHADYYRHENGAITFRLQRSTPGEYPITVCTIAAGQWVAVQTDGEVE